MNSYDVKASNLRKAALSSARLREALRRAVEGLEHIEGDRSADPQSVAHMTLIDLEDDGYLDSMRFFREETS